MILSLYPLTWFGLGTPLTANVMLQSLVWCVDKCDKFESYKMGLAMHVTQ